MGRDPTKEFKGLMEKKGTCYRVESSTNMMTRKGGKCEPTSEKKKQRRVVYILSLPWGKGKRETGLFLSIRGGQERCTRVGKGITDFRAN